MGESTVITHAMLTIVAITITSILAGVIITASYKAGNSISAILSLNTEKISSDVRLIYVSVENQSGTYVYNVYLKNVGTRDITSIESMDVFLGSYGSALDYFRYNETASPGYWNYTETDNVNGLWDVKETLVLHVYSSTYYGSLVQVKVVLPTGVAVSNVESLG